jgi:hypothetical protein
MIKGPMMPSLHILAVAKTFSRMRICFKLSFFFFFFSEMNISRLSWLVVSYARSFPLPSRICSLSRTVSIPFVSRPSS